MTWDKTALDKLDKETEPFRTNRDGKMLLGEAGMHNFLQSKGILGKRSKPGFWEVVQGRLEDYDAYHEGLDLLDKQRTTQNKLTDIVD